MSYSRLVRVALDFTRLLSFRMARDAFLALDRRHLIAGLVCTWIVGMGRWWDDPDASLPQRLGLGSVVYAFCLAALLWLIVLPLRPTDWTYTRVLTFVTMTSPPAILYAIPVERLLPLEPAGELNLWFLGIVAAWRVGLLLQFLIVVPKVGAIKALIAALLPLAAIVSALTALNLHRVVFSLMGSIAEQDRSAHDAAYGVLFALTVISMIAAPVLLLAYIGAIVHAWLRRSRN